MSGLNVPNVIAVIANREVGGKLANVRGVEDRVWSQTARAAKSTAEIIANGCLISPAVRPVRILVAKPIM